MDGWTREAEADLVQGHCATWCVPGLSPPATAPSPRGVWWLPSPVPRQRTAPVSWDQAGAPPDSIWVSGADTGRSQRTGATGPGQPGQAFSPLDSASPSAKGAGRADVLWVTGSQGRATLPPAHPREVDGESQLHSPRAPSCPSRHVAQPCHQTLGRPEGLPATASHPHPVGCSLRVTRRFPPPDLWPPCALGLDAPPAPPRTGSFSSSRTS